MPELLLEVGCEELPASFVRRAYSDLLQLLTEAFTEAGILECEGKAMGTPRRMIVSFAHLKPSQEDQTKEIRGPGISAAYDAEGRPTGALIGFCRGQGVELGSLRKDENYVWATKEIPGRPTAEIIADSIPKALRSMTFEKTMRWGEGRIRFARPVRWILAAFDGQHVAFEFEGVKSGLESRGHRFYSPDPFAAQTIDQLLAGLRLRKVEPDPAVREDLILTQALATVQSELNPGELAGVPELPDALVAENVFLTEWPVVIQGRFREEYQTLPEAVLVTAMAKHERMFPVRTESGELTNRFLFVRNSGEEDSVRAGCEWVLNARFNDAKFFFDEDSKHDLDYFLAKTEGIVFQEKLGSVRKRADRLAQLTEWIASETGGIGREIEFSRTAGLYAKADLSTGLVSEMSSLQGVIGGDYARRNGLFGSVAWAISTQYDLSKNVDPSDCAGERISIRLAVADQLDKLAGYLGIGFEPTGSSDPYGLRRAATVLIEAAWMWPSAFPSYDVMFEKAMSLYKDQDIELNEAGAMRSLRNVFSTRYPALLSDVRHDVLDAALASTKTDPVLAPRIVRFRTQCMSVLANNIGFVQSATRPINIVAAAKKKGAEFYDGEDLDQILPIAIESAEGDALLKAILASRGEIQRAEEDEDVESIVRILESLSSPINAFFESTMVMADDPGVRHARLSLVNGVARQLLTAGDFSKLVAEG